METEKLKIDIVRIEGFSFSDENKRFKPMFRFRIAEQAPNLVLPFTSKEGWTFLSMERPEVAVSEKIFFLRGSDLNEYYKEMVVPDYVFLSLLEAINEFNYSNAQSFQKVIDNAQSNIGFAIKKLHAISSLITDDISAEDLLKRKIAVIKTVVNSNLFSSVACPYCEIFHNRCDECSYAKKHGRCNSPNSAWATLINTKEAFLDALDKYADM